MNSTENESRGPKIDATKSNSASFGRISLNRSFSRGSSLGGSSRHTFTLGFGLPGSVDVQDGNSMVEEDKERQAGHAKLHKNIPIRRLAYLNKPETPILIWGSIAASVYGVVFPVFGILISSSIKTFFEPAHELRKDARFWALMYMMLGLVSLLSVSFQYFLFGIAGGKLVERIRALSFQKVVHQEIGWFDEPSNSRSNPNSLRYFC